MRCATGFALASMASAAALAQAAAVPSNPCTVAYVKSVLPSDNTVLGVTIDHSSVNATALSSSGASGPGGGPPAAELAASYKYCQVSFSYSHNGLAGDKVNVMYAMPTNFTDRFLSTGGGGFTITSGSGGITAGLAYGAAAGTTDGGFDGNADVAFLYANGTINYETLYMFGYLAIHEMTVLGQALTKNYYQLGSKKLYSYYSACSEGGREGWSQIQRFPGQWDGAVVGAPAFRFAHQQVLHLFSNVVVQDVGYVPPPCELDQIVNSTIKACDGLDGKIDSVVSRSDLCKLHFNMTDIIGTKYSCPASTGGGGGGGPGGPGGAGGAPGGGAGGPPGGFGGGPTPAQNGMVTAKGVEIAQRINDGIFDSDGKRVYLSWQPAATYSDISPQYDATTKTWSNPPNGIGGDYVERFIFLLNASNVDSTAGVTSDTLKEWIWTGWQKYEDSLQTTNPDLTRWQATGAKILHYHGESDYSIPTASSVHYYESVRSVMYPNLSFNDSTAAMQDWYQLYLIPGAGHCGPNALEPGPFPEDALGTMINWVEKGVKPNTLTGTITGGKDEGKSQQICAWPLRPYFETKTAANPTCVYDQESIDSWMYTMDAYDVPVY